MGIALRKTWHLWATGISLFPLFLINPYGVEYLTYLVEAISMDRSKISEWMPLYKLVNSYELTKFALMVSAVVFAIWKVGFRKLPGILMVGVLAYLGFKHTRQAGLFSLVWLAYVPAWLSETRLGAGINSLWEKRPGIIGTVIGIWGAITFIHLQTVGSPFHVKIPTTCEHSPVYYATGLAEYLEESRYEGNMVNHV